MPTILLNPSEGKENQADNGNQSISYADICIIDKMAANSEALNAIKNYTSNSEKINSHELSRSLGVFQNGSDNAEQEDNNTVLRDYLNTGRLPIDMQLFSGTSINSLCSYLIDSADFFEDCISLSDKELNDKYGTKIFTYGEFLSASISYDSACEFISYPNPCMLRIYAPKGTACRCIEAISVQPAEHEVTLTSNTKFQLKRIQTEADGMKTILLMVIISQGKGNDCSIANGTCNNY